MQAVDSSSINKRKANDFCVLLQRIQAVDVYETNREGICGNREFSTSTTNQSTSQLRGDKLHGYREIPNTHKVCVIWLNARQMMLRWAEIIDAHRMRTCVFTYRYSRCSHGRLAVGWQRRNRPIWRELNFRRWPEERRQVGRRGVEYRFRDSNAEPRESGACSGFNWRKQYDFVYNNKI